MAVSWWNGGASLVNMGMKLVPAHQGEEKLVPAYQGEEKLGATLLIVALWY
jgi:hypothetical protein